MKSKKHLGLVSALLGVCMAVTSFTAVTAFAEDESEAPVTTVEYGVEANNTDLVHFANPVDYFYITEGGEKKDIDFKKIDSLEVEGKVADTDFVFDKSAGTLKFKEAGTYTVNVKFADGAKDEYSATVTVKDEATPVKYVIDDTAKASFIDELIANIADLDKDDTSVKIPESFWDFVVSDVYSEKHLLTKVYVEAPKSNSFTAVKSAWQTSLSDITLSASGEYYAFYVTVKDPSGNELVTTDLEERADGFYDTKDNEDPADDELIIPIFTFKYEKVTNFAPTVSAPVAGIVNQLYTSVKITTTGVDNKVYLLYNPSVTALKPTENYEAEGWIKLEEGSEYADFATLSASSTSFTPLKKGSFAIMLVARGGQSELDWATEFSAPIVVNREIQQQKLVNVKFRNFIKNNWLSLVFLAVAVLCIVGIIILAFYKPSDEPKKVKKEKVEDDVEEVEDNTEVEEEVVEAEEEVAEEAVEEAETTEEDAVPAEEVADEAVEDPAEEVAEEKAEAPAEEVAEEKAEAPAEEVAEEVKPEEKPE